MNKGMNVRTRQSDEWETPEWLFRALHTEFDFTLDPCATKANAKCQNFFTKSEDGLAQPWCGEKVFVNPPFSNIDMWVTHSVEAVALGNAVAVLLLPVRADSDWFPALYRAVHGRFGCEMRFFRKRIPFLEGGVEQKSPRFASMVVVIR